MFIAVIPVQQNISTLNMVLNVELALTS